MFSLAKQIYAKFCPLIVKMNVESVKNDQTLKNLNAMCDVELIFGLLCILPSLE